MSEIYMVWAQDRNLAQAKCEQIANGRRSRVLRRGDVDLAQAEDVTRRQAIDSTGATYCIVLELQ
jgi:hypothetical protein